MTIGTTNAATSIVDVCPRAMIAAADDATINAMVAYAMNCGIFGLSVAASCPPDGLFGWRANTRCTVRKATPSAVAVPASPATPLAPALPARRTASATCRAENPERGHNDPRRGQKQQTTHDAIERGANGASDSISRRAPDGPTSNDEYQCRREPRAGGRRTASSQAAAGCVSAITGSTGHTSPYNDGSRGQPLDRPPRGRGEHHRDRRRGSVDTYRLIVALPLHPDAFRAMSNTSR